MNHKNSHETTRIARREDVARSIENVLPSNVPEKEKRDTVARVEQLIERYSSPYPDPDFLARINEIVPGAAEKIVAATLEDLSHHRAMDLREADQKERDTDLFEEIANIEVRSVRQGRWLGFLAYIACLIFAGSMYYAGSEKLAYAAFGTAAIGIIAQLIRGGRSGFSIVSGASPEDDRPSTPTDRETARKKLPAKK